ncbi:restriction endonuclease subunit S [Desulfofundulus sp. TPOSR]|uniref:restriction endonuclease subunit S n=1 Tax=Desulfofundulus sp. TPOSR TaxID=2714340 RepID=UPI001407EC2A|nr:restriction endonuclease subunit S [Desulfofundulus sp. TPOSR]NHM25924.1 restriction endonuclease subunit S [Desulfofundulus sp. TPOSR]
MTDGPYKLPEGWRWVRLGETCEINPRRPHLNREFNTPTSFVPMAAVDETWGTIIGLEVRPYVEVQRGYRYFQEGDVLFAKITPCMENGKATIARGLIDGIGFGSTEFHVLRPRPGTSAEWIWCLVRQESFRAAAKAVFRGGVGQQRVPQEFLESYLIPLPPLDEQRRIVAKVEALMARVREARRLRAEAKKDAERLMQAVLAEVFPRPGQDLPTGWRWVKLGEVVIRKSDVIQPSKEPGKLFNYIGLEHLEAGQWAEPGENWVSGAEIRSSCIRFHTGYVLYAKLRPNLNKVVVCSKEGIASTEFVPMVPMKEVIPDYLGAYLRSPLFVVYATHNTSGSRMPRVRMDALWEAFIPLPPLEEQQHIVAYLDQVQQQVTALKYVQAENEVELKRLEQAILDRAFKGEL